MALRRHDVLAKALRYVGRHEEALQAVAQGVAVVLTPPAASAQATPDDAITAVTLETQVAAAEVWVKHKLDVYRYIGAERRKDVANR